MQRYLVTTAAAVLAGATVLTSSPAGAGTLPVGSWGTAEEVPGSAALNTNGVAEILSVSCASAGNCSAGGNYFGQPGVEAFMVSQVNGVWGTAEEVPGIATLPAGDNAEIHSVSCASAGNCGAGGYYNGGTASNDQQAFVVNEVNGVWGTAEQVPGTPVLNGKRSASLDSVSCASAGNCSAGGSYTDVSGRLQAFVVSEVNGVWGKAIQAPGTAWLNVHGLADIAAVSCASAGNCSAGGSYTDGAKRTQAMTIDQVNGVWGNAQEVPGTDLLNQGRFADVETMSCASAGNCSAGGTYTDSSSASQGFVVSEVNGVWGQAAELPGAAFTHLGAEVRSMSCASAGNCGAGGYYTDGSGHVQAFVVSQVNGVWGEPMPVPGSAALNAGGNAQVNSVSCGSAGNCGAGGSYTDGSGHLQAFVVSEVNGIWGNAEPVPGTATLNVGGNAQVNSVSCAAASVTCSAGGSYSDAPDHTQAFVASQG